MKMALRHGFALALITGLTTSPAWAQLTVTDAWVRGTVPAQTVTGAFLTVQSAKGGAIVGVDSPVAANVEMHEMRMQNDVARMRRIERLPLPAGEPLELRPGGYHLMLIDLKHPLKAGDHVPLTVTIQQDDGSREAVEVEAMVRALGHAGHGSAHGGAGH